MASGVSNILNITVTCNYSYSYTVTIPYTKPDNTTGTTTETRTSNGTNSLSKDFVVYTHPGSWSWGTKQGSIIQDCLTATKDFEWKQWFQKVYHWKNQNTLDYNFSITIKTNDPISKDWYNERADALNTIRNSKI